MKTSAARISATANKTATRVARDHYPELNADEMRFHIPPKNFPPREIYVPSAAQLAAEAAARQAGHQIITPALLTQMFGEPPIALQRCFVTICGSITAAVLLSVVVSKTQDIQSDRKQRRRKLADGSQAPVDHSDIWFACKSTAWIKDSMLTKTEYLSAKKRLVQLDLLHERLEGVPAAKEYHLNIEWLTQLMEDLANKTYAHRNFD